MKAIILVLQGDTPHIYFITVETDEEMQQVIAPIKGIELMYVYGGRAVGRKIDMVKLCADTYRTYKNMSDPWPWIFMHIKQMLTKERV